MTLEEFQKELNNSDNKILSAYSRSIEDFKNIQDKPLNKKKLLENLFNSSVAVVQYISDDKKKKINIVTSNAVVIKLFNLKKNSEYKKNVATIRKMSSKGIKTTSSIQVKSWALDTKKYVTINLSNVKVPLFITLTEDNIEVLSNWLKELLQKV